VRVTDLTMERNFLYNVFKSERRLGKLQDMASSGRAITRPQDDPIGSERSISLRHHLSVSKQYMRNLDKARNWMEQTEQALSHLTSVLSRAHELALYGATGTTPADARQAIAAEVGQLLDEAESISNTTVDGRALLSGTMPEWRLAADVTITGKDIESVFADISDSMRQLADGLENSNDSDILAGAEGIDQAINQVLGERAENGAKLRRLDILNDKAKAIDIEYHSLLSNVEDIDLTEVIVRLKSQEAAYQAALAAGARLIQPSLLDYLR
jgi:flagellar hook-associated protein 3 FlgL